MVTKDEMRDILSLVYGTYNLSPSQRERDEQLTAWGHFLRGYPADVIRSTVSAYSLTSRFPPKPTEILALIVLPDAPQPDQAWEQARQYMNEVGLGLSPDPLHPLIMDTLKTGALGEWAVRQL